MKKLRYTGKWILAGLIATTAFSCKKDFEAINTSPKDATEAPTPQVYNAIVSSLPLTGGEQSVFNAWIYPITQQAAVVAGSYPYDNAKSAAWSNYYFTLADYRLLQNRIAASENPSSMNNMYAMLKTIMAYKTFKTTNYYGDMPYSQAGYAPLNGASGYTGAYEKQADIYDSVLTDLEWAINNFSTDPAQFSLGDYETFLKGDITKWIKFANSLRLYVAVSMYDKNNTLAATHITDALSKPLLGDGDDIGLWPANTPGLDFQWRQWSFSANCYLRMGSTMYNEMASGNAPDGSDIFDPRCPIFFEPNNAGEWAAFPQNRDQASASEGGAPYDPKRFTDWADKGVGNVYSPVNLYFEQDTKSIPELLLTAAQVHLLKAEIYNRGLGTGADQAMAAAEYEAGITASVNMWTGIAYNSPVWVENKPAAATASPSAISNMLSQPTVAYNSGDAAAALKQIYAQLWIDQFRQPWDAWLLLRRTGGMTPMSTDNTSVYESLYAPLNRFVYPDEEARYNTANWKVATNGNDVNSNMIWINR